MSIRLAPRAAGRGLTLAAAVWFAAALQAGPSDSARVEECMRRAEKLARAACTASELNLAAGQYNAGFAWLRKSRSVGPGLRRRFLLEAEACWERWGDYDRAGQALEALVETPGIWGRTQAKRRLGEMEPLVKRWRAAVALRDTNKRQDAAVAFGRIAKDYPTAAASALFQQALQYCALKQPAQAEPVFRQVATAYPGTYHGEVALMNLGWVYYDQRKYQDALASNREFIQVYGDKGDRALAHLWIARALLTTGRTDDALRELPLARRALATAPEGARQRIEARIAEEEARAKALKDN